MNVDAGISALDQAAFKITGMTCDGCARTIERLLSRVPGVQRVKADFDLGIAVVTGTAEVAKLVGAVEAAGYGASLASKQA